MDKQERFKQTALQLIHEKGFKAMTMRDLANELSCDIKNLYNYTSSKPALLEELLFEMAGHFHAGADAILNSQLSPIRQLEEVIRLHIDLSFTKSNQVALLVNEWRNLEPKKLVAFKKNREDYENKIRTILNKGIAEGVFKRVDVETALQYFLGSLRWLFNYSSKEKSVPNSLTIFENLKTFIMPGLLN